MELLFNLLIFSLPLGVVSRVTVFPNVSFYFQDILVGAIFVLFLFKFVKHEKQIVENKLFKPLIFFIAIALLSLLINIPNLDTRSFLISFSYLARLVTYSSLIFALRFTREEFRGSIPQKLIASGLIFTIFGFIQYFWYPSLRNLSYAGWDEHLYRLFSTFFDPNFAGVYLVLYLILVSSHLAYSKQKLFYGIIFAISLLGIYLTYSRSALISLIVGISLFLFINRKVKIIIPVLVFLAFLLLIFSDFKIEGLNPFRIVSTEARINSAREAMFIISENPVLGVGFNAYRYSLVRYGFRDQKSTMLSNADAGTDNSFLFILATTGIVGFIVFLNFIKSIYDVIPRKIAKNQEILSSALLPSFGALLISSLFINSIFYIPIQSFFFILLGIKVSK